jgi:hypothetical protein
MASAAKAYPDVYPQYANYDPSNPDSVKAVINEVYKILFNKDASTDPDGVNYWVNEITSGKMDLGTCITTLEKAAEEYLNSDDAAAKAAAETFVNRAAAAVKIADTLPSADINGDGKIDANDFKVFQDTIKVVTNDSSTIDTAVTKAKDYAPVDFDLTSGKDNIVGTDGPNTFKADLLTLNDGDSIDGKGGVDTLNAEISNNITDGVTVKNVENVNVTGYGNRTINMKNFSGVENFTDKDSTGTLTLNNVGNNMKLTVEGNAAQLRANFTASALQGTSDVADITLKNATAGNVQVNSGFESLNLHVDGDSALTGLTVPGVNTAVIDGTGDLTLATDLGSNIGTQVYKNDGKVTYKVNQTNVSLISAQDNTKGFVDATETTKALGDTYANNSIALANDGTVLLGSGNDSVYIQTNGTNTISTGDGTDKVQINQNATGDKINLNTGAGDDKVYVSSTTALDNSDVINTGDGNDSVIIADSGATFNPTLKNVETLDIKHNAASTINLANADSSLKKVNIDNSTAAQNITLNNVGDNTDVAVNNWNNASPASIGNLSITYANQVDAKTFDINTTTANGATLTINKVTNATVNYNDVVASASNGGNQDFQDSQTVTINTAKAATFGNIISTNNKTETLTINGKDAVTTGALTSTALKDVNITAEKALSVGTATASNDLNSIKYISNSNTVDYGNIGGTGVTKLSSVEINAAKNIGATAAGTIDAQEIDSIKATSTGGNVTLGAIASAAAAEKLGTIDVSAKTNVTLGPIGTGNNDTLDSLKVTANNGAIALGNINMSDADGFDMTLNANTTIDNGSSAAITVANAGGNINTVTLEGAASAQINFGATAAGKYVSNVDASDLKGGLTSTITNNDTLNSVNSSTTVSLGAKDSSTTNAVTILGQVDNLTVNGSEGQDTITLGNSTTAATINEANIALGGGTDTLDLTNLNGIQATANGAVINLSSSAQTVGNKTVSAGHIMEYDGTNALDNGYNFTVSGLDKVVGTNSADVIYAANTGTTIDGGDGNDTITLGAGTDTVKFDTATVNPNATPASASTTNNNGDDDIKNFVDGDKLDFSALIGSSGLNLSSASLLVDDSVVDTSNNYDTNINAGGTSDVNNKIAVMFGKDTITGSDIAASATDNKITLGDNGKAVVVLFNNSSDHTAEVYYIWDKDSDSGEQAYDAVHIATIEGNNDFDYSDLTSYASGIVS